jgi:hypothetical protein
VPGPFIGPRLNTCGTEKSYVPWARKTGQVTSGKWGVGSRSGIMVPKMWPADSMLTFMSEASGAQSKPGSYQYRGPAAR